MSLPSLERDADRTDAVPIHQLSDHNFESWCCKDINSAILPQAFYHQAFHDSERYDDGTGS